MKVTRAGRQITVNVRADGDGLVSHAGSALLAQVADKSGLTRVQTTGRPPNSGPPSRPAPDPPAATREWTHRSPIQARPPPRLANPRPP